MFRNALFGVPIVCCLMAVPAGLRAATPVEASPVAELETARVLDVPAEMLATNHTVLAAEVSAPIVSVYFDAGDPVEAGTVLVRLDARDLELALAQAEADLVAQEARIEQARIRLQRARTLAADRFLSEDELLQRTTDYDVLVAGRTVLEVRVQTARHNLTKAELIAPFSGTVQQRQANLGALAVPGAPLMTLVQSAGAEVVARVPEGLANALRDGRDRVFVDQSGRAFAVDVERISNVIDATTRNRIARLKVTEPPAPLIGASGRVRWTAASGLLPADVLVQRDGQLGVFIVAGDSARFHPLSGAEEGRPAGHSLAPDVLIVTAGRHRLNDGDEIQVGNP